VHSRSSAFFGLLAFVVSLCACKEPLGPGYWIEQQSYDLNYAAASPAHIEVRATYRIENTGNSPLDFIRVTFPDTPSYGRENLRIHLNGRDLSPRPVAGAPAREMELPFDPPWPRGDKRELMIEYHLAPAPPGNSLIAVDKNSVLLRQFGWFPELHSPEALFAKSNDRAEKVRVTIRVPRDFLLLSNGRKRGTDRRDTETEYRFELREDDADTFLVAGRYLETRAEVAGGDVIFWTFELLPGDRATQAAARIAASYHALESFFGRLEKKQQPIWVVETPAQLASRGSDSDAPAGVGFPAGALLNRRAFTLGVESDSFLELVEHELAHRWFGQTVSPRPEADPVLSEGLAEYATLVAAEARGGEAARRRQAALLLRWYDEARNQAVERPLEALRSTDPWEERVFAYNKGALFFVALEDEFGKENIRHGLARLVYALRGEDPFGYNALRSALEGETQREMADFFRTWLYQTGIPDDFRARYEIHPAPEK